MPTEPSQGTLSGKIAIVTGASRGIGLGIAFELAKHGAKATKVAITYTSSSSAELADGLVARIDALRNGSSAVAVCADLRDPATPLQIVEATLKAFSVDESGSTDANMKEHKHIDILVNNAGAQITKPLSAVTIADYNYVYDLNVRGTILMTQAVLPYLRSPGRIVNISSVGARSGFAELSLYCSSKAAIEGLTRCLAAELGKKGHTINAVSPGPVQTDLMAGISEELVEMQRRQTPVGNRIGDVDDVAQVVAFLTEEGSRWISGQVISASGGWAMY